MFYRSFAIASGLYALSAVVSAGSASVHNGCGYPVYLWVADSPAYPEMITIQPGSSYSEGYKTNPDGGGVSMKVGKDPTLDQSTQLTQFEYTIDSTLWYDLSVINGDPFFAEGQSLHPDNAGCQSVRCKPGQACNSAYYQPDDNSATHACDLGTNVALTVCTAGGGVGGDSSSYQVNHHKKHHHKHHKHHHHKHHHHKHHHKHHHHHHKHHRQAAAAQYEASPKAHHKAAPVVTTLVTQVITTTQYKRDAAPTPVVDSHLGARHAHNYHIQHRHGLSH